MASDYDEQDIDKNKDILLLDNTFHKVETKATKSLRKKIVTMGMITF